MHRDWNQSPGSIPCSCIFNLRFFLVWTGTDGQGLSSDQIRVGSSDCCTMHTPSSISGLTHAENTYAGMHQILLDPNKLPCCFFVCVFFFLNTGHRIFRGPCACWRRTDLKPILNTRNTFTHLCRYFGFCWWPARSLCIILSQSCLSAVISM